MTESGRDVFGEWLAGLKDVRTRAKVVARIDRLPVGNFGDCKALPGGLFGVADRWGPGYGVYCAMVGKACVLLLCGGDKRRQSSDIKRALEYLKNYKERTQ